MIDEELRASQRKFILETQLGNCCSILNGKLSRVTCVDSKGKVTKKIIIEYHD